MEVKIQDTVEEVAVACYRMVLWVVFFLQLLETCDCKLGKVAEQLIEQRKFVVIVCIKGNAAGFGSLADVFDGDLFESLLG